MIETHNKPLAAQGLRSYRYVSRYGFIMIGATSHADALAQAARSLSKECAILAWLDVWDGQRYSPAAVTP